MSKKVAVVTGANGGLGLQTALALARKGMSVVMACRNLDRAREARKELLAEVPDAEAPVIPLDVSEPESIRDFGREFAAQVGRLDVLVNNAATTTFISHGDLDALTEDMWDRMLAVNLKGAFFVTRAAADLLRGGDGGSVVNISSVAGMSGAGSSIAYCASKAGLNTMTKSLARVFAPTVRVNAVCPGPIESRWIREGAPDVDIGAMVAGYPIPKASLPDDVADAVLFFASGTSMATGQLLSIDGGLTL